MAAYINTTIQSVYHLLGYGVPSLVTNLLVNAPLNAMDALAGPQQPPREGRWLIAASAGNARNHLKLKQLKDNNGSASPLVGSDATADDGIFDSMDFFGFSTNADARRSAYGFTSEQYPYPLYSGHYHTIIGGGRKSIPSKRMHYEREVITSSHDGNTLFLEWRLCDAKKFPNGPKGVIAVVPGLCSGPNSSYVQRFVLQATAKGFHVVVIACRGMGSAPLDSGNLPAGTFTYDIAHVLEEHITADYLEKRFGDRELKVMAIGFSLGGAMLANHFAKTPNSRAYCGIIAEAPWDFHHATAMMSTRFAKMAYQPALMKGLWNVVRKTGDQIVAKADHEQLRTNVAMLQGLMKKKGGMKKYSTVNDFDTLIVAPSQGFGSACEYYTAASPFQRLGNITIPLLCFSAMDDPITGAPPAIGEWNAVCNENHNILHVRCPTGGHLGFMRGPIDELSGKPGFMDERLVKAFEAAVSNEALLAKADGKRRAKL